MPASPSRGGQLWEQREDSSCALPQGPRTGEGSEAQGTMDSRGGAQGRAQRSKWIHSATRLSSGT